MRAEDISALQLAKSGKLGKISFFRYFLSTGNLTEKQVPTAIYEAYQLAKELNGSKDLKSIYTSANHQELVLLITGGGEQDFIVNLFFDFTNTTNEPIKQMEIAGTLGIYQFNSTTEAAFQSNFLENVTEVVYIDPEEQELAFYKKVKESYRENKPVCLGGES